MEDSNTQKYQILFKKAGMSVISCRLLRSAKELLRMLQILPNRLIGHKEQLLHLKAKEAVAQTGLLFQPEPCKAYMP